MEQLAKADWEKLESDVVARIHCLRDMTKAMAAQEARDGQTTLNDRLANDLVLTNLRLLAAFCENITIEDTS